MTELSSGASGEAFGVELVSVAKRCLAKESLPRIKQCLGELSEEEVWERPNDELTSVGNLVLHLCGNVRQWIISALGGAEDVRDRDAEFSDRGPISKADLVARLENTVSEACEVLDAADVTELVDERTVQGYRVTNINILVHVTEHFSYHTGQITWYTKLRKNIDLG